MPEAGNGWVERTLDAATEEHRTFVFEGAEFEGTLRLRENFRVDSEFRGEIVCDGTVTVGETGGVEATIRAREVVIVGAVVGNVYASRRLAILASGRLHGDVETPCVEIERGAVFNGRMEMVRPEVAARAAQQAAAPTDEVPAPVDEKRSEVLAPRL
jgi:cytoskeletal protein CcmA (bactofilin family)